MRNRFGLIVIAGVMSTAIVGLSTNSSAQSCGCETSSSCSSCECKSQGRCRSCCTKSNIVLHVQREPLLTRRSLSIAPEAAGASVASAPIVQSVALTSPMMFQVQPVAVASYYPMQAIQPVAFNSLNTLNTSTQANTVNTSAPTSTVSEDVKNLTKVVKQLSEEVKQISAHVNAFLDSEHKNKVLK